MAKKAIRSLNVNAGIEGNKVDQHNMDNQGNEDSECNREDFTNQSIKKEMDWGKESCWSKSATCKIRGEAPAERESWCLRGWYPPRTRQAEKIYDVHQMFVGIDMSNEHNLCKSFWQMIIWHYFDHDHLWHMELPVIDEHEEENQANQGRHL